MKHPLFKVGEKEAPVFEKRTWRGMNKSPLFFGK